MSATSLRIKYLILTLGFALPLGWASLNVRNLYPVASWNVMTRGGQLEYGRTYFVLRGETVSGEQIDIPAIKLSGAMRSRNWGMVEAIANNQSLRLNHPHPRNVALLNQMHGQPIPDGLLMKDLLKSWGATYNNGLAPSAPGRLKAIRIDSYRWPGQAYSNFFEYVQTWREEL